MSESGPRPGEASEEFWRDFLINGDPRERALRNVFRRIPTGPRCKACAMPFGGVGRRAMGLIGKHVSDENPNLCNSCFDFLIEHRGGAEIECSMLFADIRGSTTIAEHMEAREFTALLRRFYHVATEAIYSHDGGVDKFVGDEVVAMFFPLAAGDRHAVQAIAAAEAILDGTGHRDPGGPWLPVGAGVHTGQAWVGAIGDEAHVELTALGDAVNTAARLASVAAAGEILVSVDAARSAGLRDDLPQSMVELKGKEHPVAVVRLGVHGAAETKA